MYIVIVMYIVMDVSLCPCLFGDIGHQMSYIFVFKCATIQYKCAVSMVLKYTYYVR